MSTLRRRFLGTPSPSPSPARTPTNGDTDIQELEDLKLVSSAKLHELKKGAKHSHKRRNSLIFILGGLFGVCAALFTAQKQEVFNFEGILDLNLDSLIDVIPAGVIKDAKDLTVSFQKMSERYITQIDTDFQSQRDMNAKPSTMILSPSAFTYNLKALKRCTRSSWSRVSYLRA